MLPSTVVECPYCGELIELVIDDSVAEQRYIEDCAVCCRPIEIEVIVDQDAGLQVRCTTDNEI